MVKLMEIRHFILLILILMPSIIWLLLKQVHSPWWLENMLSTPFIVLVIYSGLMLLFLYFLSYSECFGYFVINFIFAIFLNNSSSISNIVTFKNKACIEPITLFQFNMKYAEDNNELNELIELLVTDQYHLITLQGVSQKSKQQIIEKLSPYYPYFIRGENHHQQVYSDQLLFSRYAFSNIKYYKNGQGSPLISSQWQLPFNEINLYTLHPPSPRNEDLWQSRNKTLYQLKNALEKSTVKSSLVIGDLNLSKHSNRLKLFTKGMNTVFVNTWPNKRYFFTFFGLAIDHFWVSKTVNICYRQRLEPFSWSDHYAVKTQVDFNK